MRFFQEVFEAFPNVIIDFELKTPSDELIEKTNALIKEFKRENITIWGCKHNKDTKKLTKTNPNIPIFFPGERVIAIYFAYFFGLLPFIKIPEDSIQIPMLSQEYAEQLKTANFPRKVQ